IGRMLISQLRQETFDLLLLDWNVPDVSALEVLEWMRGTFASPPPALIITARSAQSDVVAGLNAGADDFIVKPVHPGVLLARVNAVLRRAYPAEIVSKVETFGPFTFDPLKERVIVGDREVAL